MSTYHRTSVIFDDETPIVPGVHESSISGRVIGSVDIGDGGELVLMPKSRTDVDRLVAALVELGMRWDAEAHRLQQPALILVDLETGMKS
ncbi:hypothetical protein [Microlunatus speluncae]|uniref:hypothetical protein n=1 Tax=Microlunatus speluncae TaxID=2594267 RepID=UPI0012664AD3|nr:hypothetical protein [Microlunatus speluncae]